MLRMQVKLEGASPQQKCIAAMQYHNGNNTKHALIIFKWVDALRSMLQINKGREMRKSLMKQNKVELLLCFHFFISSSYMIGINLFKIK